MAHKAKPKMNNLVGYCHKECPAASQDQAQHFADQVECSLLGRHKEVKIEGICPVWARETAKRIKKAQRNL